MHHRNRAWLPTNCNGVNAFGPDPQSDACRVTRRATLQSPQHLCPTATINAVGNNVHAFQALLDLIRCPTGSGVTVPTPRTPLLHSTPCAPNVQIQRPLAQTIDTAATTPRVVIVSLPVSAARTPQVISSIVPSAVPIPQSATSNSIRPVHAVQPVVVHSNLSSNLDRNTTHIPRASPLRRGSDIVHVPTAQYIDRETLELANKVFSLYDINGAVTANLQPNANGIGASNHSSNGLNAPIRSTSDGSSGSGSGCNAFAAPTGHATAGGTVRVRHPGVPMPDKNGWNKPQHVPLQKQSVNITDSAKPQRTTHPLNLPPIQPLNGLRQTTQLIAPSMFTSVNPTINGLIPSNPLLSQLARDSQRDSQSQSVPNSVQSVQSASSLSSSGRNGLCSGSVSGSALGARSLQSPASSSSGKFRCRYCDKECGSECRLEVHLRSHTGDQPYKCTMAGCGKAFKQKVNLKRHLNKHLNNGEFACSHCDRRFVYKCDLTAHQRIHSGEKPFGCNYCLKRFNQKRDLSRHLNTHSAHRTNQGDAT